MGSLKTRFNALYRIGTQDVCPFTWSLRHVHSDHKCTRGSITREMGENRPGHFQESRDLLPLPLREEAVTWIFVGRHHRLEDISRRQTRIDLDFGTGISANGSLASNALTLPSIRAHTSKRHPRRSQDGHKGRCRESGTDYRD